MFGGPEQRVLAKPGVLDDELMKRFVFLGLGHDDQRLLCKVTAMLIRKG
jgi:hypothetical protein